MRGKLLARSGALIGCAVLATVTGAASCSTTASSVTATGKTLSIYISAPASLSADPQAQDVVDAERLAYQQLHGEVTAHKLAPNPNLVTDDELSGNARTAIGNTSAIAYLGELDPGSSADSIGITNAEDLLQVSPTDTAVELNQRSSSNGYYESYGTYGQTFARVVPTSAQEARALATEMQALGVRTLYATSDGSAYGNAITSAVKADVAPAITLASSPTSADAVFYGGSSAPAAARLFNQVAGTTPAAKLFAPSALADEAFVGALTPAAQRRVYVSQPGFLPSALTPPGRSFVASFRAAYGHAPATQAIFGYEAMSAVLEVLKEAGSAATNRSTVVNDFLRLSRSAANSVLGAYSIGANGNISIAPFVLSRVIGGQLTPYRGVPGQG